MRHRSAALVALATVGRLPAPATAACNADTFLALSAFYHTTNGPNWDDKDNWMDYSKDPCETNSAFSSALHSLFACAVLINSFPNSDEWNGVERWSEGNTAFQKLKIDDDEGLSFAWTTGGGSLPTELGLLSTVSEFKIPINNLGGERYCRFRFSLACHPPPPPAPRFLRCCSRSPRHHLAERRANALPCSSCAVALVRPAAT